MSSALALLTIHKSRYYPMGFKKSSCLTSFAAIRQAAIERLDHLVSAAWCAISKEPQEQDDAARVRQDIEILKATNELDLAVLLNISHSCKLCNHDARLGGTERTSATDFAESLIKDTRESLNHMMDFATRINNRNAQIQKLEQHLKTVGTILKSMNVVLPGNGMTYSYKIDPDKGINLVIQGPDNSDTQTQTVPSPTDLLDSDTPQSSDTPVLKATRTRPPTPIPELVPALVSTTIPTTTTTTTTDHTETENKAVITTTKKDKLKIPSLQIWDTPEEHDAARRQHQSKGRVHFSPEFNPCPLIFSEGIYQPRGPFDDDADPETESRMVIFSELHPETTYRELLDKVRGGPIIHVARANSTTMVVSFLHCRDAHAYANYVNDPSRRRLKIRDVSPRVTLVETPSYPLCISVKMAVHQGVTRCLEIPSEKRCSSAEVKSLLEARGPWAFTETPDIEDIVVRIEDIVDDNYNNDDIDDYQYDGDMDDMFEEMMAETSAPIDQKEMQRGMEPDRISRPLPPFPALDNVLRLSFRNIMQAEKAYGLIKRNFHGCGVSYIRDRCAGPLKELDIE
ncbi:hypothetical protein FHL15_008990 [Xylaria flabelliformis]|uniref:Uncharacterized protein n=1 Tax=Xylaria flabelliformis TaxID=2512241 RepID=A0A553HQ41_9PEZI|nr:hypothetical protein FHL15_008990 [Xylaria flabelliformis]